MNRTPYPYASYKTRRNKKKGKTIYKARQA